MHLEPAVQREHHIPRSTGKGSTASRVQQARGAQLPAFNRQAERAGAEEAHLEAGKVRRVVHQEGVEVAPAHHLHSQRPLLLLQGE